MFIRHICYAGLTLSTLLAGCSLIGNRDAPGDTLVDAERAIARAEQSRVGDYDAVDLRRAHEHLAAARAIAGDPAQQKLMRLLAAESRSDAELAIARAQAAKAKAVYLDLQRSVGDLQQQTPATNGNP